MEGILPFNGVILQIEFSSSRFSRAFFIGKSGLKMGILTIEITLWTTQQLNPGLTEHTFLKKVISMLL